MERITGILHNERKIILSSKVKGEQIRLLIVDDHVVVRKGLALFLRVDPAIQIVGEATDGVDALRQAERLHPDVILMDIGLPRKNGVEVTAELKKRMPEIKVIMLTSYNDESWVRAAMNAGAQGYLLKDLDQEMLLQAIQAVQDGGMPLHPKVTGYLMKNRYQTDKRKQLPLTEREIEVLQMISTGLTNKRIAQILHLTLGTVKVHVKNILRKLNVASRTEAAKWATQMEVVNIHYEFKHRLQNN